MDNKKWVPSQEENYGIITSVYEFIKEELSELQKKTGCPDSFIYDFNYIFNNLSLKIKNFSFFY